MCNCAFFRKCKKTFSAKNHCRTGGFCSCKHFYHFIGSQTGSWSLSLWLPRILFSGTSWDLASVVGSEVWKEPTDGSVCEPLLSPQESFSHNHWSSWGFTVVVYRCPLPHCTAAPPPPPLKSLLLQRLCATVRCSPHGTGLIYRSQRLMVHNVGAAMLILHQKFR